MSNTSSEVVIIGGGIVGLSTAYFLANLGITSTVIERDTIASHASGFSYAALGTFDEAGMDGKHFQVASEGMRLHRNLDPLLLTETGLSTEFRERPQLWLAFTEEEMENARHPKGWDARKRKWEVEDQGQTVSIVDAEEALNIEPRITPSIVGAIYTEGTADVNAFQLTMALSVAAQNRGVRICYGKVVGLKKRKDKITGVLFENSEISCQSVVISMGPWSELASPWINSPIRMSPWKGQILRLQVPGPPIQCSVAGKDHFASTKPDGLVWVGPTFEDAGLDETPTRDGRDEIMTAVTKIMPYLSSGRIERHTACIRPLSADRKLVLGKAPAVDGAYIATGGGRLGLMMGPAMGLLTAELISTGVSSIPLDEFDPDRFVDTSPP